MSGRPTASLAAGFGAFLTWGLLPIFFKAMAEAQPIEIVAHRIVWAALLIAAFVGALRQVKAEHGLAGEVGVAEVARFPGAFEAADQAMYEQKRQRAGQHTQIAIE